MDRQRKSQWLLPLFLSLGMWLMLVTLISALLGILGALSVPNSVAVAFRVWVGWLICTPLAIFFTFSVAKRCRRFTLIVAAHLIACLTFVLVNQVVNLYFGTYAMDVPKLRVGSNGVPAEGPPRYVRIPLDVLFYTLIVSICVATAASQRSRNREHRALKAEARLTRARLETLQMQLNPHFLFNSLNAIAAFVHTDPKSADNMLADLSALLRASLDSAGEQEIPLRRELEVLNCYLDIERVRFADRLQITQSIESDTLDALVPTLILQPLVENAVRHGIEPKATPGTLEIHAARQGDQLVLRVRDTGDGVQVDPRRSDHSVGLSNTRDRLKNLYSTRHTFDIRNARDGGCVVTVELPYQLSEQHRTEDTFR